ncbi:MAG: hypothetical protein J6R77_02455 [Clostridia bacterium]|nr:hypothetical protein [Clostridia bacterium]
MRYFKYDGPSPNITHLKEKNKHLSKKERWGRFLGKLGTPLFFLAFILLLLGSFWLLGHIPEPDLILLNILMFPLKILLYLFAVIASALIGALVAMPFWNKRNATQKKARQRILAESCEHLRTFYQLQEPCVVTKCYESHDKRFVDHDVCLFFVENELRITTNLKNGFLRHSKDLGCYALEREEITVSTVSYEDLLATEITAGDACFLLGRRAKAFVEPPNSQ